MRISERIRPSNLLDSETYRNINGITLQLGAIQFLMTDGAHGISHVSNLFREMVKLYKEDSTECLRRSKFSQLHRTKSVTHEFANLISRQS